MKRIYILALILSSFSVSIYAQAEKVTTKPHQQNTQSQSLITISSTPVVHYTAGEMIGCWGTQGVYLLEFFAFFGGPILEYDVDVKSENSPVWLNAYNGSNNNTTFYGPSNQVFDTIRARARNSSGWGPFSTGRIISWGCGGLGF